MRLVEKGANTFRILHEVFVVVFVFFLSFSFFFLRTEDYATHFSAKISYNVRHFKLQYHKMIGSINMKIYL